MPQESQDEHALVHAIAYLPPAVAPEPVPATKAKPTPSGPEAALRRCQTAWRRAFKAYMDQTEGDNIDRIHAAIQAGKAWCQAMPLLASSDGIRDFLACAAHGMLIGAIPRERSGQLLYAVQIALGTVPSRTQTDRKPPKPLA